MAHPALKDIEDRKGWTDMGKTAYYFYKGAVEGGASKLEAYLLVAAYFRGIVGSAGDQGKDEDG